MDKTNERFSMDFLFPVLLGALAFLLPFLLGRNGLLLFDYSVVIDAGWRIFNGQLPHVDFVLPSGPGCFALQALFFKLCGPNLYAPLVHAGVMNLLATLLVYWIVRKRADPFLALFAAGATALWFYAPYPFPWYDTTAFFFLLAAHAVHELRIRDREEKALVPALAMGLLVGASFLSKQNIGLFGALLFGGLAWHSTGIKRPMRAMALCIGFAVIVGGYLLFNSLMGGFEGTVEGLFSRPMEMGRGERFFSAKVWTKAFHAWPVRLLFVMILLLLIHLFARKPRRITLGYSLDLIGLNLIALLAAFTGTAPKQIFLPFVGLCAGLFAIRFLVKGRLLLLLLLGAFMAWGIQVDLSRVSRAYALKRSGFDTPYVLKTERLKPFTMDDTLGPALDDLALRLEERDARGKGFYAFPNLTVLYMAMDYLCPLPYVWIHPGQSFFQKVFNDEARLIEALEENPPEWLVLWNADYNLELKRDDYQVNFDRADLMLVLLPKLRTYLLNRYEIDFQAACFRIMKLKEP